MSLRFPRARLLTLTGLLAAVLAVALIPGSVYSAGIGQEGHFEWAPTGYAAGVPNDCPQGTECWEWCFVGPDGAFGTKRLCCVNSLGQCIEELR